MTKEDVLQRYFGYNSFRPGQADIIDCILSERDAIAVLPTGGGKSICFQVPALMLPGVTLVVSPLISLMKDQVRALRENGIPAAFLNGELSEKQQAVVCRRAAAGQYRLLYIAPERLQQPRFLAFAQQLDVRLFCVDEAHCVSQWGKDFRPSYLQIAPFLASLSKRPTVCALTATATARVREDMEALLDLHSPRVFVRGFDRENLYFETVKPNNPAQALRRYLDLYTGRSGIVYCAARKTVDHLFAALSDEGYSVARYHAGMEQSERARNQEDFIADRRRIMLATNAFGMGIDKPNVSFVIHYNLPGDIESYYQEAGRAGRDGLPADCILFYNAKDIRIQEYFIANLDEDGNLTEVRRQQLRRHKRKKLQAMVHYAESESCLRRELLTYFGETPPSNCGNCSVCCGRRSGTDVTVEAQKILSCVARAKETAAAHTIVAILKGTHTALIDESSFDRLSTFGVMAEFPTKRIEELLWFLVSRGDLRCDENERLHLSGDAKKILFEKKSVRMDRRTAPPKAAAATSPNVDEALYRRLLTLCKSLAQKQSVPYFVIFTDRTLRRMAAEKPSNASDFLAIPGVSLRKYETYGAIFLKEIAKKQEEV